MDTPASHLRDYLASTDAPCPNCNYNLRGLTSEACPECNQKLTLRVGLDEPRLGSLIGAASGFLAGAGAGFICLALVLFLSIRWGPPPSRAWFSIFLLPTLCLAIGGGVSLWLLRPRGRAWFRTLNRGGRGLMIAGGWVLTILAAVVFAITFNA